ncbi:hypothetical protein M758_8G189300 [Ceratodon purpureus]|uniref:Uncharacterized protein n=1 Tax=Ceratodon purpureus TaxID=3225 RepID=A0A8T0H8T1_CERPU|nr:hypothetical protein KC19_8G194000 [Ceratodon purpureus]KAG0609497.1 hypothetical protein M758_8G189300 [Ceratodon purpureus]
MRFLHSLCLLSFTSFPQILRYTLDSWLEEVDLTIRILGVDLFCMNCTLDVLHQISHEVLVN